MADTADILIIGGGIIGMVTALELQTRDPSARITVLEKSRSLRRISPGAIPGSSMQGSTMCRAA